MSQTLSECCRLIHPAFAAFGPPTFRRAETDRTPVMVVSLGEREASLPLRALQREFGIPDDSDDGRMLGLIAEALDYVQQLSLGDMLPGEVLDGHASWEPGARHLRIAASRLQAQLIAWLTPRAGLATEHGGAATYGDALLHLDDDPATRAQIQAAFERAAIELGLEGPPQVVVRLEALAEELSYIEALRDRFAGRVQTLVRRVGELARGRSADMGRLETLTQVERLAVVGLRGIDDRLAEVDAQTEEVISALRNADSQRSFIRSNRDWLYRASLDWEPILAAWDSAGPVPDDALWALIARTYRFLARHFMPATAWPSALAPRRHRAAAAQPVGVIW